MLPLVPGAKNPPVLRAWFDAVTSKADRQPLTNQTLYEDPVPETLHHVGIMASIRIAGSLRGARCVLGVSSRPQ